MLDDELDGCIFDEVVLSICKLNELTPKDDTLESMMFDDFVRRET